MLSVRLLGWTLSLLSASTPFGSLVDEDLHFTKGRLCLLQEDTAELGLFRCPVHILSLNDDRKSRHSWETDGRLMCSLMLNRIEYGER